MRTPRSIDGFVYGGIACACAVALMACAGSTSVNNGGKDGSVTGTGGMTVSGQGGSSTGTGGAGVTGAGGARTGAGGARTGTGGSASGAGGGPATGTDGGATSGCTVGAWPAADPSVTGPFATVTENNVGPGGRRGRRRRRAAPMFTLFRPTDLRAGRPLPPGDHLGQRHRLDAQPLSRRCSTTSPRTASSSSRPTARTSRRAIRRPCSPA